MEVSSQRMREVWVVVGDWWGRREDKLGERGGERGVEVEWCGPEGCGVENGGWI